MSRRSCSARAAELRARARRRRRTTTTCSTGRRSPTPRTTSCIASCSTLEEEHPDAAHGRLADAARRRRAGEQPRQAHASRADAVARATRSTRKSSRRGRSASCASPARTCARAGYNCELKIDGAAVSLTYRDGVLVEGTTRGNGIDRRERHGEPAHDSRRFRCGCAATIIRR